MRSKYYLPQLLLCIFCLGCNGQRAPTTVSKNDLYIGKQFYEGEELVGYTYKSGGKLPIDTQNFVYSLYAFPAKTVFSLEHVLPSEDLPKYEIIDTLTINDGQLTTPVCNTAQKNLQLLYIDGILKGGWTLSNHKLVRQDINNLGQLDCTQIAKGPAGNGSFYQDILRSYEKQYQVVKTYNTDLNQDGIEDRFIVLHEKRNTKSAKLEDSHKAYYRLAVMIGVGSNKYNKIVDNDKALPNNDFSGDETKLAFNLLPPAGSFFSYSTFEDPKGGETIVRRMNFRFEYSTTAQDLILAAVEVVYKPYGQDGVAYKLTPKDFGPLSLSAFDIYSFSPKKYIHNDDEDNGYIFSR